MGRTGILTPVALLQPVDVGGVTVSRATLHNEDEVRKKDLRPGDLVRIERAGDVIPEVVERVKQAGKVRGEPFSMPKKCPACGADVYREGAYSYCSGKLTCYPQIAGGIIHYGSREALNISGLGQKTALDMVKKGIVKNISDLYCLKEDELLELEGFAKKSARQLHQAIEEARKPRLDRFLFALGIRHVGRHVARILAEKFGSIEELKKASPEDLEKIPEIGPEIAESVFEFFRQETNLKVLEALQKAGVEVQEIDTGRESGSMKGKTFVFTGKLEEYTRQEAEDLVEALGGRATGNVSGETDYVVAGEDPGSKYEEARKQNIAIINEKEFERMAT